MVNNTKIENRGKTSKQQPETHNNAETPSNLFTTLSYPTTIDSVAVAATALRCTLLRCPRKNVRKDCAGGKKVHEIIEVGHISHISS